MNGLESWTPSELPRKYQGKFDTSDSGLRGADSGRTRFRVVCKACKQQLHEATTFPNACIEQHECKGISLDMKQDE